MLTYGGYILFARVHDDQGQPRLMRSDGSDLVQVVDELTPTPGPASGWFGYYGHLRWDLLYDWWVGPPHATRNLKPAGTLTASDLPSASPPATR